MEFEGHMDEGVQVPTLEPIDGNWSNTALGNWFPYSAEELERLRAANAAWLIANGPDGWIEVLRLRAEKAEEELERLRTENVNLARALAKEVNDPTFMGEPVIDPRSKPIAWVVAVEEGGRMKVYGPQYNWRGHAEQDAELPRKRGQKAEVWACYPVAGNGASTAHIESAPKDGTPFLAWVPSYYQGQGAWIVCLWMHGDWMDNRAWKVKPTLWLPLPEAPR